MMPSHPHRHLDDETLNAVLDGEASDEERAEVDSCDDCSARRDRLGLVASALAVPGPPPDPIRRRAVIDVALREGAPEIVPAPAPASTSRRRRWVSPAWAAAAAVIVAGALAIPLGNRLGEPDQGQDQATAAREADDPCPGCGSLFHGEPGERDAQEGAAPAPVAPARERDLGAIDLADLDRLADSLERDLPPEEPLELTAPGAAPGAETTRPGALAAPDAAQQAAVQPCEGAARQRDDALGPLVYAAGATVEGRPVVVLAFEVPPLDDSSTLRLLVLASDRCGELGSATS